MAARQQKPSRPSHFLSPEENQAVFDQLRSCQKSLATSWVTLHLTGEGQQSMLKVEGAVCLVKDNSERSFSISIFCPNNDSGFLELQWGQKIFEGMQYNTPERLFHTFQADTHFAGLSFCRGAEDEAQHFAQSVRTCINILRKQKTKQKPPTTIRTTTPGATNTNSGSAKISAASSTTPTYIQDHCYLEILPPLGIHEYASVYDMPHNIQQVRKTYSATEQEHDPVTQAPVSTRFGEKTGPKLFPKPQLAPNNRSASENDSWQKPDKASTYRTFTDPPPANQPSTLTAHQSMKPCINRSVSFSHPTAACADYNLLHLRPLHENFEDSSVCPQNEMDSRTNPSPFSGGRFRSTMPTISKQGDNDSADTLRPAGFLPMSPNAYSEIAKHSTLSNQNFSDGNRGSVTAVSANDRLSSTRGNQEFMENSAPNFNTRDGNSNAQKFRNTISMWKHKANASEMQSGPGITAREENSASVVHGQTLKNAFLSSGAPTQPQSWGQNTKRSGFHSKDQAETDCTPSATFAGTKTGNTYSIQKSLHQEFEISRFPDRNEANVTSTSRSTIALDNSRSNSTKQLPAPNEADATSSPSSNFAHSNSRSNFPGPKRWGQHFGVHRFSASIEDDTSSEHSSAYIGNVSSGGIPRTHNVAESRTYRQREVDTSSASRGLRFSSTFDAVSHFSEDATFPGDDFDKPVLTDRDIMDTGKRMANDPRIVPQIPVPKSADGSQMISNTVNVSTNWIRPGEAVGGRTFPDSYDHDPNFSSGPILTRGVSSDGSMRWGPKTGTSRFPAPDSTEAPTFAAPTEDENFHNQKLPNTYSADTEAWTDYPKFFPPSINQGRFDSHTSNAAGNLRRTISTDPTGFGSKPRARNDVATNLHETNNNASFAPNIPFIGGRFQNLDSSFPAPCDEDFSFSSDETTNTETVPDSDHVVDDPNWLPQTGGPVVTGENSNRTMFAIRGPQPSYHFSGSTFAEDSSRFGAISTGRRLPDQRFGSPRLPSSSGTFNNQNIFSDAFQNSQGRIIVPPGANLTGIKNTSNSHNIQNSSGGPSDDMPASPTTSSVDRSNNNDQSLTTSFDQTLPKSVNCSNLELPTRKSKPKGITRLLQKKEKPEKIKEISQPTNVRHLGHIGYGKNKHDYENVFATDQATADLMKKMGFSVTMLEDPDTMNIIHQLIERSGGIKAAQEDVARHGYGKETFGTADSQSDSVPEDRPGASRNFSGNEGEAYCIMQEEEYMIQAAKITTLKMMPAPGSPPQEFRAEERSQGARMERNPAYGARAEEDLRGGRSTNYGDRAQGGNFTANSAERSGTSPGQMRKWISPTEMPAQIQDSAWRNTSRPPVPQKPHKPGVGQFQQRIRHPQFQPIADPAKSCQDNIAQHNPSFVEELMKVLNVKPSMMKTGSPDSDFEYEFH